MQWLRKAAKEGNNWAQADLKALSANKQTNARPP